MKRILLLICLALMLSQGISLWGTELVRKFSPQNKYSIAVPAEWETEIAEDGTITATLLTEDSIFPLMVMLAQEPLDPEELELDIDDIVTANLDEIINRLEEESMGVATVLSHEVTTIQGYKANAVILDISVFDVLNIRFGITTLKRNDTLVLLMTSYPDEMVDTYKSLFQEITDSISFE